VRERATHRPLLGFASGVFLCLSITATGLVAAPNDAADPRAPSDVAPSASSLVDVAPAGLADWRLQMAGLKSDLTLTLDGMPVQRGELERTIISTTNNDRKTGIIICSDENVPPEQLSNLAEQVKTTDFNLTVIPRPDPR